jgi:hypothetical protein
MTALHLGNCDLVRCTARADGGWRRDFVALRARALAIRTREALGYNHAGKTQGLRLTHCRTSAWRFPNQVSRAITSKPSTPEV